MNFSIRHCLQAFFSGQEGATTVEYALLLALIIVFSVSAILSSGDVQQALWFNTADRVEVINQ
jgi:Flp pilus assembly pilin Flp